MPETEAGENVHVAVTCDENYVMPLAAMLVSLESHLARQHELTVHVLGSGLAGGAWRKLRGSVPGERVRWNCIDVQSSALTAAGFGLRTYEHFSAVCFFRLLLPELLPQDLDKVLYLDSDLIVLADVGELWSIDVRDVAVAAVAEWDWNAGNASSPAGIRLHRQLGMRPEQRLFNAGVLLLNLERWRKERVAERAFNYLREGAGDVRWYEQEALNVVSNGNYLELEPRWNVPAGAVAPPAGGRVAILHYLSARKPWHWYYDATQAAPFFSALDRTRWSGWRPARPRHAAANRLVSQLGKAARKRIHRVKALCLKRLARRRYRSAHPALGRIDSNRPPPDTAREIRLFLVNPVTDHSRFSRLLTAWFDAGVERAVVLFDAADFGLSIPPEYAALVHVYRCESGVAGLALRHLLQRFGRAHCCVLGRGSELLLDGDGAIADLRRLNAEMDVTGAGVVEAVYERGEVSEQVELTARDAQSDRIFRSTAYVTRPARSYDRPVFASRAAVLSYSDDFLLNAETTLCAGLSRSATLLRVRDGRAASAGGRPA